MGAEIFFWWMVVAYGGGTTTIPVPYQTQEMCKWSAEQIGFGGSAACIPQPAADVAEFSAAQAVGREPEVCVLEDGLTNQP